MSIMDGDLVESVTGAYNVNYVIALAIDGSLSFMAAKSMQTWVPQGARGILPFLILPAVSVIRKGIVPIGGY